ncbi:MAG TPA: hypothetical protein VM598_11240 [Bdellovibrionota bacterium]|nr:hypothetical protein [Bdellovibrionota bacterium]
MARTLLFHGALESSPRIRIAGPTLLLALALGAFPAPSPGETLAPLVISDLAKVTPRSLPPGVPVQAAILLEHGRKLWLDFARGGNPGPFETRWMVSYVSHFSAELLIKHEADLARLAAHAKSFGPPDTGSMAGIPKHLLTEAMARRQVIGEMQTMTSALVARFQVVRQAAPQAGAASFAAAYAAAEATGTGLASIAAGAAPWAQAAAAPAASFLVLGYAFYHGVVVPVSEGAIREGVLNLARENPATVIGQKLHGRADEIAGPMIRSALQQGKRLYGRDYRLPRDYVQSIRAAALEEALREVAAPAAR